MWLRLREKVPEKNKVKVLKKTGKMLDYRINRD